MKPLGLLYSSSAVESPLRLPPPKRDGQTGSGRTYGHYLLGALEIGGQFFRAQGDSVIVLDTEGTANLVCVPWLGKHNSYLQRMGFPLTNAYPSTARFKYGDGRVGEVRYAAEIKVGIAGRRASVTALVMDADILALLRWGTLEAPCLQSDF